MIECEFELCIYQKDGRCIRDKVKRNAEGMCEAVIVMNFPITDYSKYKEESLKRSEPDLWARHYPEP